MCVSCGSVIIMLQTLTLATYLRGHKKTQCKKLSWHRKS